MGAMLDRAGAAAMAAARRARGAAPPRSGAGGARPPRRTAGARRPSALASARREAAAWRRAAAQEAVDQRWVGVRALTACGAALLDAAAGRGSLGVAFFRWLAATLAGGFHAWRAAAAAATLAASASLRAERLDRSRDVVAFAKASAARLFDAFAAGARRRTLATRLRRWRAAAADVAASAAAAPRKRRAPAPRACSRSVRGLARGVRRRDATRRGASRALGRGDARTGARGRAREHAAAPRARDARDRALADASAGYEADAAQFRAEVDARDRAHARDVEGLRAALAPPSPRADMLDAASAERAAALASAADGHRRLLETAVDGHDAAFAEAVAERAVEMSATNDFRAFRRWARRTAALRGFATCVSSRRAARGAFRRWALRATRSALAEGRPRRAAALARAALKRAAARVATKAFLRCLARAGDAALRGRRGRVRARRGARRDVRRAPRLRRVARARRWTATATEARSRLLASARRVRRVALRRAFARWNAHARRVAAAEAAFRKSDRRRRLRARAAFRAWVNAPASDSEDFEYANAFFRRAVSRAELGGDDTLRVALTTVVLRAGDLEVGGAPRRVALAAATLDDDGVYLGPALRCFEGDRVVLEAPLFGDDAGARAVSATEFQLLTEGLGEDPALLAALREELAGASEASVADKVHAVERGASELRGSLENVELCRGALHKRGGMLKTGKKIFHRHAWKEKTFVLRARAFDDRNVYLREARDDLGGLEPRDAFRFDVVERSGAIKSLYAPTAADRDRWLGAEARDAAVEALRREADDAPLGFAAADELAKGIADVERDVDGTDFLRTGLCGVVIHGGFLIHKRKKRRYFKVRAVAFDDAGAYVGPRLEYAVEEDDDVVLGTYLLDGARVEAGEDSGFDLRYDHGTVSLVAASAEDRSEWLLALEEALSQHHDILGVTAAERAAPRPVARDAAARSCPVASADALAADVCAVEDRGDEAARRRLAGAVARRGPLSVADGGAWRRAACSLAATFTAAGDYAGPALLEECGGRVVATPLADRVARPCDPSGWDLEPAAGGERSYAAADREDRDAWTAAIGDALAGHSRVLAALGRGRAPKTPLTHDDADPPRRVMSRYAKTEPNATTVTPADFDAASPVVVAAIHGSAAMGEIFGKSKITGGTRCGSWSADRGEII
ncbi:hypothetical protein JL722_6023 [Aureococcus anophagefferens]|nr:hypothetical protein JL722_6023 [Aureococcus anophagefferens]